MFLMNDVDEKQTLDELIGRSDAPPTPGHDVWFRKKVKASLKKAKDGKATYSSLDEVAAKFGFDAR